MTLSHAMFENAAQIFQYMARGDTHWGKISLLVQKFSQLFIYIWLDIQLFVYFI